MKHHDLIRRLLDGDLTTAEEQSLRDLAGRDPEVARELSAYESLLRAAAQSPRPELPDGFEARLASRLAQLPVPRRTLVARLVAPRFRPAFSWTGLTAAAAASLAVVAGATILAFRAGEARGRSELAQLAPSVPREAIVRFVLHAPEAQRVQLAGDFNAWKPDDSPLARGSGGLWTTTVRLAAGRHQYLFVVDGDRWVPDPTAAEIVDDGFGGKNAVIEIL